jgi:hypothetical protein
VRFYKIVIKSALVIITLLTAAVVSLFYASDTSLNFLTRQFFNSEELTITAIQGSALNLNGLSIESAEITAPGYTASTKGLSVSYDLASLYQGVFHNISLAELNVKINDGNPSLESEQTDKPKESDSLESMVALVANQPFDELSVGKLRVFLPNEQIDGSFKFASKPSSISGQFNAISQPTLKLAIDSSISSNQPLSLSLRLTDGDKSILDSEALVTIDQNSFSLTGTSEIAMQEFLEVIHNFDLLRNLSSSTPNLQLSTNLQVENILTDPIVQSLDVAISNQAGSVQFQLESEGNPLVVNALLPLQIISSATTSQSFISLEAQKLELAASGEVQAIEIDLSLNASSVKLNCNRVYDCELRALISARSSGLHAQDWDVEELQVSGIIAGFLTNGIYSLHGSDSAFSLIGATYDQTTASITSALMQWRINQPLVSGSNQDDFITLDSESIELVVNRETEGVQFDSNINTSNLSLNCKQTLDCSFNALLDAKITNLHSQAWSAEELNLTTSIKAALSEGNYSAFGNDAQIGVLKGIYADAATTFDSTFSHWAIEGGDTALLSAQAQFQVNDWNLNYGEFQLEDPVLSGNLSLSNNELVAAIEVTLQSSLGISGQLNSNLNTGSGSLSIEVPQFSITQASPLSSYIAGIDSQFDIIAGEIAAAGKIDWITDNTEIMQFSGPMSFKAENVSGAYEDYFFFGLTTDLRGEFANPLGLKTLGVQTARIGTAELGLPIRDITWGYEFNSADSTMAIYDLTGNLLGGKISVPEAKFKDFSSNTELTVVISELDLDLVTALAEYPELQVRGIASGYLPIYLQDGVITMRKGLVSALNPGGSIRYTPVTPSTNASIKFVNDALSNYQFKALDSQLNYDETGDLNMQVNLRGGNPDMPAGQQINVNLNIINNVPDMLESLRASRSIEDALERNLQRQK